MRRKNGAEKPFNIKVWSLGNEMDGDWQIGHKTAYEYGRLAHETAKVMRLVDPSIELVASGSSLRTMPTFGTWEETLLDHVYDDVDYLSLHQYYDNYDNNLAQFLGKSVDFDGFISDVVAVCDAVKARRHSNKKINLSMDEWNVWYHSKKDDDKQAPWQEAPHLLEDHYNFEDALLVGSLAITLMKHADRVKIGCLAQLINVIAPIMTNTSGEPSVWYQSIFYPFMQVSNFAQGIALSAHQDVPAYKAKDYEVPYTDSMTTYDSSKHELVIFVENKSSEKVDFETKLANFDVKDLIAATQFCGYDIKQTNEDQSMKLKTLSDITVSDNKVSASLQPLSWNVIRIHADD